MGARLIRLLVALGFAGALAVATSTGTAYACDCAIGEPAEHLARATVAFDGTVTAISTAPSVPGKDPSLDPVSVAFAVESVLKGVSGESIELITAGNSAACGIAFSVGERWRIYASGDPGNLSTGSCSGNELLGQDTVPAPSDTGPPTALLLAGVAALVVATVSTWAFTRRAPKGSA